MALIKRNPATPPSPRLEVPAADSEPAQQVETAAEPAKPWLTLSAPLVIRQQSNVLAPGSFGTAAGLPGFTAIGDSDASDMVYETPIYTMFNPDTGSRVTLVANRHDGQREYFRELKRTLTDLEAGGATIHYECIYPATDQQLAATTEPLRKLYEEYTSAVGDSAGAYVSLGIVDKGAVFEPEPTWEIHDISRLKFLEAMGLAGAKAWIDLMRAPRQAGRGGPDVLRATLTKNFAATPKRIRAGIHRTEWIDASTLQTSLFREAVAMGAADAHLARRPGSDLGLLWGIAHIPGFREAFAERGYKDEDERWITAIDLRTLKR